MHCRVRICGAGSPARAEAASRARHHAPRVVRADKSRWARHAFGGSGGTWTTAVSPGRTLGLCACRTVVVSRAGPSASRPGRARAAVVAVKAGTGRGNQPRSVAVRVLRAFSAPGCAREPSGAAEASRRARILGRLGGSSWAIVALGAHDRFCCRSPGVASAI